MVALSLAMLSAGVARSQELAGEIVSREVRSENDVVIVYNLRGIKGVEYDVDLYLIWGTINRLKLEKATGDIGRGIFPGMGKTIHWDMKSELTSPIEGMAYHFELDLRPSSGGGLAWYWYAGGAAVVAGGIAILVIKPAPGGGGDLVHPSIPLPPGGAR